MSSNFSTNESSFNENIVSSPNQENDISWEVYESHTILDEPVRYRYPDHDSVNIWRSLDFNEFEENTDPPSTSALDSANITPLNEVINVLTNIPEFVQINNVLPQGRFVSVTNIEENILEPELEAALGPEPELEAALGPEPELEAALGPETELEAALGPETELEAELGPEPEITWQIEREGIVTPEHWQIEREGIVTPEHWQIERERIVTPEPTTEFIAFPNNDSIREFFPMYYSSSRLRCRNCRKSGHSSVYCPNRLVNELFVLTENEIDPETIKYIIIREFDRNMIKPLLRGLFLHLRKEDMFYFHFIEGVDDIISILSIFTNIDIIVRLILNKKQNIIIHDNYFLPYSNINNISNMNYLLNNTIAIYPKKTYINIEEELCPICYEEFHKKTIIKTDCSHTFCFECIEKSTKIKKTCPICRGNISSIDLNVYDFIKKVYDSNS